MDRTSTIRLLHIDQDWIRKMSFFYKNIAMEVDYEQKEIW
jgi:hypothetical protein